MPRSLVARRAIRPVLPLVAAACLLCCLFIAVMTTSSRSSGRKSQLVVLETRANTRLASLRSEDLPGECWVDGRLLQLGRKTASAYQGDSRGRPRSCLFCECTIASVSAPPRPRCEIIGCWGLCPADTEGAEWRHVCCTVCLADTPETTAPPASISAEIPLTGRIYDGVFRHLPAATCGDVRPPALLAVTSRPQAAARRALFRRLYAAEAAARGLQLVFVLGRDALIQRPFNQAKAAVEEEDEYEYEDPADAAAAAAERNKTAEERRRAAELESLSFPGWQRAVDAEAALHQDILQSNVSEHYFHLGLKTLSLLDWAGLLSRRCGRPPPMLVKTDDDVVITVRRLAEDVMARAFDGGIHGRLCVDCAPQRGRQQWASPAAEWPRARYPVFAHGPGYLIAGGAVAPLFETALRTPYHHLEDVFVAGIVAEAAGVERHEWERQCFSHVRGGDLCALSHCALSHSQQGELYRDGGEAIALFQFATRRFNVDALCASNRTMTNTPSRI